MAPEMAVSYVIGTIPSLSMTGLHFWFHRKKIRSATYQQLQKNLSRVDKFWSEHQGRILQLSEGTIHADHEKIRKSLIIMGAFFFFMSWLGFFFNTLVFISLHYLAVSRLERKLFESELSIQDLQNVEVEKTLLEIQSQF